ncbi:hypothetical protein GWC95_02230 [Sediminibacterium roseum]|uniref:Uncharacterized protein n=1 Tax=Sediminibacterium roseum TaxID=1978412 RepID=A0ABW9ZR08_9BACT|nr:hypothetical protein [Sediminibacterium roseum]NCI48724.1 hypothetical protein [Sediminibacterium roseum]
MSLQLPKIIQREGITIVINVFRVEYNPLIKTLDSSAYLLGNVQKPKGFVTPIVKSNHVFVDLQFVVKTPELELPAIIATTKALLSDDEPIADSKHVWNLVDEYLTLISEDIKENNVVDKNGDLISLGHNNFATDNFEGII